MIQPPAVAATSQMPTAPVHIVAHSMRPMASMSASVSADATRQTRSIVSGRLRPSRVGGNYLTNVYLKINKIIAKILDNKKQMYILISIKKM